MVTKLNKLGYLADKKKALSMEGGCWQCMPSRRRMIKGILHGESDSRRTTFIEPEETTSLNNDIFHWKMKKEEV